jgi:hypothetical protein
MVDYGWLCRKLFSAVVELKLCFLSFFFFLFRQALKLGRG